MSYLLRKTGQLVLVVLGAGVLVFCLSRLSGDPVSIMFPLDTPRAERERFAAAMGLDRRHLVGQYARFLCRVVQGDFGRSIVFRGRPWTW